jgi:hypothetical protein
MALGAAVVKCFRVVVGVTVLLSASACGKKNNERVLGQEISPWAVDHLSAYQVGERAEFPIRLSAQQVQASYKCKYDLERISLGKTIFQEVFDNTYYSAITEEPDMRSGLVFYDRNDKVLASVFFDRDGRRGEFNGKPVAIRGKLYSWMKGHFSCE